MHFTDWDSEESKPTRRRRNLKDRLQIPEKPTSRKSRLLDDDDDRFFGDDFSSEIESEFDDDFDSEFGSLLDDFEDSDDDDFSVDDDQ